MHLRKIQISFYFEKFNFASKEDTNKFLCKKKKKKIRFASKEDAN